MSAASEVSAEPATAGPVPAPRRRIVLVSGAPATGKTTLAGPLAAALGFPLIAKDHIKETLHDALHASAQAVPDPQQHLPPATTVPSEADTTHAATQASEARRSFADADAGAGAASPLTESRRIGAAAMALLWSLATRCPQAVLEANFQAGHPATRPALDALDATVVEVHCACPADEAARRFRERAPGAHRVHVFRVVPPEVRALSERPVGYGPVIVVDTTRPTDPPALAAEIARLFESAEASNRLIGGSA